MKYDGYQWEWFTIQEPKQIHMPLHLSNYFLLYIIWLSCSIRPRSKWDQEYTGMFISPVNSSSAIIRETQFSSSSLLNLDDHCFFFQNNIAMSAANIMRRGQLPWPGTPASVTAASICGFYQTTKNRDRLSSAASTADCSSSLLDVHFTGKLFSVVFHKILMMMMLIDRHAQNNA